MRSGRISAALAMASAVALFAGSAAFANDSTHMSGSSMKHWNSTGSWAPHLGQVHSTKQHRVETVLANDEIRVFVYTQSKSPEGVDNANGSAKVKFRDGSVRDIPLTMQSSSENGISQEFLEGRLDTSAANPPVSAKITLAGLGGKENHLSFSQTFHTHQATMTSHHVHSHTHSHMSAHTGSSS